MIRRTNAMRKLTIGVMTHGSREFIWRALINDNDSVKLERRGRQALHDDADVNTATFLVNNLET